MTSTAQIEAIRAEIAQDVSESAYQCELEYHLDYMLAQMMQPVSEDQEADELTFA